jgi:hypothetical protein
VSYRAVDAVIAASFDRGRFTNAEVRLLVVIAWHHNRQTGQCDPGLKVLADETGFSKAHVVKLVRALEERGELAADRSPKGGKGHRTSYTFPLGRVSPSDPSRASKGSPQSDPLGEVKGSLGYTLCRGGMVKSCGSPVRW